KIYGLTLGTLTRSANDFVHLDQPKLAPGASLNFSISLRLGPGQSGYDELAADVFAKYAHQFPRVLEWPDRRPIAMLILASTGAEHHSATNPRGWLNNPKLDVTTTEGLAAFEKSILAWADRSVERCKSN